jgi:hypothetical protein
LYLKGNRLKPEEGREEIEEIGGANNTYLHTNVNQRIDDFK